MKMAAWSKTWAGIRSLSEIVGYNHIEGMDISLL
jgi:hypothetical protein